MTHLNCFPPRVAGVNFSFFIAVLSGGECWYYAKCEMVLCKIDGKMNIQNCGYFTKWQHGDGGDWCSRANGNGSCHGLAPSCFEEMTRYPQQKQCRRTPGNPNCLSKFHKYRAFFRISRIWDRDWCSALLTAVATDCRRRFSKKLRVAYVKNIAGDDQATLMFDRNSTKIAHCFRFYVYKMATDAPQLTATSGDHSNGT